MSASGKAMADALRIQQALKRMVLLRKVTLPLDVARRIVGPDCAFLLYAQVHAAGRAKRRRARTRVP
jgi:hypothetical protein